MMKKKEPPRKKEPIFIRDANSGDGYYYTRYVYYDGTIETRIEGTLPPDIECALRTGNTWEWHGQVFLSRKSMLSAKRKWESENPEEARREKDDCSSNQS